MKVLIIAPHPDDEILGCGGIIDKYKKRRHKVSLCIVTCPYTPDWSEEYIATKKNEIEKAKNIIGIDTIYFLDFPTVKLDTIPQKEINDALSGVVREVSPEIVYIPHKGDLNKDHRTVFEAALVALRPTNNKIRRILSYETLSETEWGQAIEPFIPNVYVDISENIKQKCDAMNAYQSEMRQAPHPRSVDIIIANAKKRGSEICVPFAEAFVLIRECDIE